MKVAYKIDKDMLSIIFNGIWSFDDKVNLSNKSVEYKVELFDKEALLSSFENFIFIIMER